MARPIAQAAKRSTIAPTAVRIQVRVATGLSTRLNGTVAGRCPGAVGVAGSGSWIVTAFTAGFGTVIGFLHLGQGPVRPANWSLTVKREPQLLQRT